jgi:hypothetical protein
MKKIFTKNLLCSFTLLFAIMSMTNAQVLFTDNFNYSGLLTANGWTAHSGAGNSALSTTTGLTYAGMPTSGVGNAVLVQSVTGGEDVNQTFTAQNTDGQSIYVSALLNVTETASSKSGDYFLHLGPSPIGTSFAGRVAVRVATDNVNFGISMNNTTYVWGGTSFTKNTTYLFILKYTINTAGDETASIWVFPSGVPASEVAAGAPLATVNGPGQASIGAIAIRQGGTNLPQTVVDGLLVGTAWTDVTAVSTSPLINAGPAVSGLSTTAGTASAEGSFNVSGNNLTPAAGNLAATASTGVEVSLSAAGPYATAVNIPYTAGALSSTTVYVRIAATALQGALNGTVTISGGGASPSPVVNVTGAVSQAFYNTKGNLGLNNLGTWSSTPDGTGPSPANFTDAYQYFNIVSQANANYSGVLDITPNTSRLVVGNGIDPLTFTILPGIDSVTSATRVDVLNNATLVIQNERRPFLNNLSTGSTVDFAQTGITSADTVRVPALSYYNLKLTGGLKYFASGTITTRGNLTFDGVVSTNGSSPSFTTINALGNVSFLNNSAFEPIATGDASRLTLKMNSTAASSTLSAANTDVLLFRLQRDSSDAHSIIIDGANASLTLGNAVSGGLALTPENTTMILNAANLTIRGGGFVTNNAQGSIFTEGGNVVINKTAGASNAGVLRFVTDSYLNNFTIDLGPSVTGDSVVIANDISINGVAAFTNGKVTMASGQSFTMTAGSSITGGSTSSFLRGTMIKQGNTGFSFPIGKENKYAPVSLLNISTNANYSIEYFNEPYPVASIDPGTAATYPAYNISRVEYWTVNRTGPATADITFNYTDASSNIFAPNAIRMAHFDGTDWNDIGGTPAGGNTGTSGSITVNNVSDYSPFTFGAIAGGVLPVKISKFSIQKSGTSSRIFWTTEQEINSHHFVIERSTDQRTWTTVATVAAAGTSTARINYSTTDFTPAKGINFYRLKLVDVDNSFENSVTRSVLFGNADVVLITPNPATSFATIYMGKNNNSLSQIFVTDMNGKLVERVNTADQTHTIQTARYSKGLYIIKVVTEGNTSTHKLVVQ